MSSFQAVTITARVYPQAPVSLSLTSAVIPSPWSLLTLIARSSNENDSDEDDNSPSISRSSSLLFGFLITFLALFIGFMACGYSSRRSMRLNQAAARHLGGTNPYRDFSKMKKPRIWEVWIAEDPGKERWTNMMPLSASLAPTSTSTGPLPSHPVMAGSTTTPDRRDHITRWDLLSTFFTRSSRRQHNFASPPPPMPRRTTVGPLPSTTTTATTTRPAYDPNPPESFFVPPADFRLPPHPSLISVLERECRRNRTANEERRRATVDASGKRLETHARISVLIAMPRSNSSSSSSSTESTSHVEKAHCQGPGPEGRHDSENQPWADYELGVAHVPLCPPGLISRPGNNNHPRAQIQTGGG